MPRPVDRLHRPDGWAYDRMAALRLRRCAKCGQSVPPTDEREELDLREYLISGVCPTCWDLIFPEGEDE